MEFGDSIQFDGSGDVVTVDVFDGVVYLLDANGFGCDEATTIASTRKVKAAAQPPKGKAAACALGMGFHS